MEFTICKKSEIPSGNTRAFVITDRNILVCNVNGNFYAIDNVCTHDEGSLQEGELIDEIIECPRHGAQFSVKTGKALTLPAVIDLNTYPVKVAGDDLIVSVNTGQSNSEF